MANKSWSTFCVVFGVAKLFFSKFASISLFQNLVPMSQFYFPPSSNQSILSPANASDPFLFDQLSLFSNSSSSSPSDQLYRSTELPNKHDDDPKALKNGTTNSCSSKRRRKFFGSYSLLGLAAIASGAIAIPVLRLKSAAKKREKDQKKVPDFTEGPNFFFEGLQAWFLDLPIGFQVAILGVVVLVVLLFSGYLIFGLLRTIGMGASTTTSSETFRRKRGRKKVKYPMILKIKIILTLIIFFRTTGQHSRVTETIVPALMSGSHLRRWCNRSGGQSKPPRSLTSPQLNQNKEQCPDQHHHHLHRHHHHRHYHQCRSPRLQQSQRHPKFVLIHGRPLDWAPPLPSTWSLDRRRRSKQHHHHHDDLQLDKCQLLQWRLIFWGLQQSRKIEILIWRTTCSSEEPLHSRQKSLVEQRLQSNPGQQQKLWNDYRRRKRKRKRNMKIRPRSLRLQVMWPSTIGTEQAPAALVKNRLNAERRSGFHRRDHPQKDLP